jgi:prepilin-type processing-associated H-X9-DG protein
MNTKEPDYLGYALKSLGPQERADMEAILRADPSAAKTLNQVQKTVEWLALDAHQSPPVGLIERTLARIDNVDTAGRDLETPKSDTKTLRWPGRRLIELAVAAAVLATATGLVVSWVGGLNSQRSGGHANPAQLTQCQNNLRTLYQSLQSYSDKHQQQFPNVSTALDAPRNVAGLVFPMMWDAGVFPADGNLACPGAGGAGPNIQFSVLDVRGMDKATFQEWTNALRSCYAYSLGYRNQGQISADSREEGELASRMPLMSDSSPPNPLAGNSLSHGGLGQNVLFCDGHVTFCPSRLVGVDRDDIFLNRANKVAAGLDRRDAVLASGPGNP